ncbi:MAG: hypothetical protein WCI79_01545 [Candidatus Saccharibacteria bacterium]
MKHLGKVGFTVVETMLFLGITGLLVVSLLVGVGSSINTQRYRDSVTSLQALLQKQYSEVANVTNNRGSDWDCTPNGVASQSNSVSIPQGQSNDCVILGRLITSDNTGKKININSVVGVLPKTIEVANDADLLKYKIHSLSFGAESYDVEWGSSLNAPGSDNSAVFSVLIIRSPINGVIKTFINNMQSVGTESNNDYITDTILLLSQPEQKDSLKLCVNSGGLFGGNKMAVYIQSTTSGASGVEKLGDDSGC